MFKKILVPLDGSFHAEHALALVKKLFSSQSCELVLVEANDSLSTAHSVHGEGMYSARSVTPEYNAERSNKFLNEAAESANKWADRVHVFSLPGAVDQVIIEVAEKEKVDLIVMVTHGYAGLKRLLLGSVTEKVIRLAPCPVLAIRDDHIPKHFLIAVDGTPFSETILNPAYLLARLIKADITFARIHIASDDINMQDLAALRMFDPELAHAVMQGHNNRTESYLKDLANRYTKKSYQIRVDYDIESGPPAARLAKMAKRNGCDLIAMATHGRNGIKRFLEGSITEDVMHRAETAMLVIHPDIEADE
ncbi:MAG: universal stress protein [Anaerolineae bacterium]